MALAHAIPSVHFYGLDAGTNCNVMIMDLLGDSLENLFS